MIIALRTELFKLRTIRVTLGMLAVAIGLSGLTATLKAARAGGPGHMAIKPLYTADGLTAVLSSSSFALVIAVAFGATIASGEFRHQTATATYLATPDRTRVLIAKALAAFVFGLGFGLLAGLFTTAIGLGFVSADGYSVAVSTTTIVRYILGATIGAGLLAAVGVGIGSLIRNQLAALIAVFAWALVIEQIVGSLWGSVAPYLPFTAATTLAGAPPGADATSPPFASATVLVAAFAAVVAAIADRITVPADIT
jgi:ABC-2 type transport system permease protein